MNPCPRTSSRDSTTDIVILWYEAVGGNDRPNCFTHNILAYRFSGCELETETHELGCHQPVSARERTPVNAVLCSAIKQKRNVEPLH